MKKVLIAGIVGGLIVFAWGALSHMVLQTGGMGLKPLPNEDAALAALRESTREPGVYFIPGVDMSKEMTAEEEAAWNAKFSTGPTGLLVLHYPAPGEPAMGVNQFLIDILGDVLAALLLAYVLVRLPGTYGLRVLCVVAIAVFGWLAVSVPYWNWYHFSTAFTLSEGLDQVVGWLLAGLAMAKISKPV